MKVIKVKNYEELSRTAATIIAGVILSKPDCILGLATGSSPVGTYDQLAAMYEEGILDFSHVKSVNLDEYVGLDGSNDQSYRYFMNKNLFSRVNIDIKNTYVPDGTNPDTEVCCEAYNTLLKNIGAADLQLLGIGPNGHIGFNEPDDHFQAGTGQTGVGADHIGAELGLADRLCGGRLADEHLIGAVLHAPLGDAVTGGGVALGVQIHDEHLFAQSRHAGGQVDGGGGLADAAFLVCDCYNFCHAHFFLPGNFGCSTWNIRSCARSFPVARTSQLVV